MRARLMPERHGFEAARLLAASAGNEVMLDIARVFADGFAAAGVPAELVVDGMPDPDPPPSLLQLVVAPHEYFPLFLEAGRPESEVRALTRAVHLLNVEQPGSQWFEIAYRHAKEARGVLDISALGAEELERRGIDAMHAPLGYSPRLEAGGPTSPARPVDVVFLGSHSPRREAFFSRHADFFAGRECRIHFARLEKPRLASTKGFVSGQELRALLASSRVLVNVHSRETPYFEWHRALIALANGCLVVSETSRGVEPLLPGEHLVMEDLDRLPGACRAMLEDEGARSRMAERARRCVRERLSAAAVCEEVLARLGAAAPAVERMVRAASVFVTRQAYGAYLVKEGLQARGPRPVPVPAPPPPPAVERSEPPSEAARERAEVLARLDDLAARLEGLIAGLGRLDVVLSRLDQLQVERINSLEGRHLRRELGRALESLGHPTRTVVANRAAEEQRSPSVSVVVTLFNYAGYIGQCLRSAGASDASGLPGGLELLVVDDGSTDGSVAAVEAYMASSTVPVRLVKKALNTGLADARNAGLREARAPYVFILDADNWIYPRCLRVLHDALMGSGHAAVYGILKRFDEGGAPAGLGSFYPWDEEALLREAYVDAMALFDKQAVLAVDGYSTELVWLGWEDYDLWLKLAQAGRTAALVPQILCGYRTHPASMIRDTNRNTVHLAQYFRKKFGALVGRHPHLDRVFGFPR